ncbi:class I SAM-dependent methyltransferase [Leptolyngbya sp. FACHB-541]|uniref:O-methyltransferase n=1 Tax=Leptolyngbya sp. FACHB-541 TaxID=2692810 RepID=UPI001F551F13|nr:class I SAM-dependent methyltransferase [Leptolyngbya sp. FACHB-541]
MTFSVTPDSIRSMAASTPNAPRPVTPLGIAVEHLEAAVALLAQMPDVSDDLAMHLQKALVLMAGLDPYLEQSTTPESPELTEIAERTHREAWQSRFDQGETVRPLEQEMLSGHVEGQTLKLFVHMTGARRILDIGMFTGYSALAMAETLPADGYLVACEVDPYTAEFAQSLFQRSPHGSKIQIELGAALETLEKLTKHEPPFDFVFIDADKQEYIQYYQKLLDSNLLAENGYICVDNTLFQGQVYSPEAERSTNGQAIAQFNQFVAADSRTEQVLLPLRDGLTLIRRV